MLVPQEHGGSINRFEAGQSGNPNGRQRKVYTILKEKGFSADDIRTAFREVSWDNIDELQRLFKDDKTPAIIKVIAHAYKRAIEKGDYRYVQEIIEQVIGRPKETFEGKIALIKFDVKFNEATDAEDTNNI